MTESTTPPTARGAERRTRRSPGPSRRPRTGPPAAPAAASLLESVRDASTSWPSARRRRSASSRPGRPSSPRSRPTAAPLAKRAGEVTADASGKLATMSRTLGGRPACERAPAADAACRAPPRRRYREPGDATARTEIRSRRRGRPTGNRRAPDLIRRLDILRAMSVRPIVLLGDPRLRLKGKPVDSFGKYLHGLLDDLAHTMRDAPGVGLAAPQLGEALQACVDRGRGPPLRAGEPADRPVHRGRPGPGGLPVDPGLRGLRDATRARLGRRPGSPWQEDQGAGSGLLGRALQHELDHLDGKLYIDYLDSMDELLPVGAGSADDDEEGRRRRRRGARPGVRVSGDRPPRTAPRPDAVPGLRRVRRPDPRSPRRGARTSSWSASSALRIGRAVDAAN